MRARLAEHWDDLAEMGVLSLRVIGSVVRGEAGPESDVDFVAELGAELGLLDVIGVKQFLEDALGAKVDLVELPALKERMRERVLREAVNAA
jgi:predicted nucleotidyltransferase